MSTSKTVASVTLDPDDESLPPDSENLAAHVYHDMLPDFAGNRHANITMAIGVLGYAFDLAEKYLWESLPSSSACSILDVSDLDVFAKWSRDRLVALVTCAMLLAPDDDYKAMVLNAIKEKDFLDEQKVERESSDREDIEREIVEMIESTDPEGRKLLASFADALLSVERNLDRLDMDAIDSAYVSDVARRFRESPGMIERAADSCRRSGKKSARRSRKIVQRARPTTGAVARKARGE